MSFASRAFSTRRNKPEMEISAPVYVGRAASQHSGKPVIRTQISSPMALVSTSNANIHNAPSIAGTTPVEMRKTSSQSTSTDTSSSDESDASSSSLLSASALTDASSVDDSPATPFSEPASYFKPVSRSATQSQAPSPSRTEPRNLSSRPPPPQRSQTSDDNLPRRRAHQRGALSPSPAEMARSSFDIPGGAPSLRSPFKSPVSPLSAQDTARSSFDMFTGPSARKRQPALASTREEELAVSPISATAEESTPFAPEIAQLDRVAQSYGKNVRTPEEDADVLCMEKKHLAAFSAAEYMFEIQGLVRSMFADERAKVVYTDLGAFF